MAKEAMGFSIPTVHDCPHTRGSGVVVLPSALIGELAGAVNDKDEWAILLRGKRDQDGAHVVVTDYFVPPQSRSGTNVELKDIPVTPDIVGVIHSHHAMGAFFSGTDNTYLNPRFPVSIVIAHEKWGQRSYFGFTYKAEGRVTLPCGAIGVMGFSIQPSEGPMVAEVDVAPKDAENLGMCANAVEISGNKFRVGLEAACGLKEDNFRASAFGVGQELFQLVKALPRPTFKSFNKGVTKNGKGYTTRDHRRFNRNGSWQDAQREAEHSADRWAEGQSADGTMVLGGEKEIDYRMPKDYEQALEFGWSMAEWDAYCDSWAENRVKELKA